MNSQLRFVSLGFDHVVCANRVWAVVQPNRAQSKRLMARAKSEGTYLDWTCTKKMKALVLLDNGYVIGSPFSVSTIYGRLRRSTEYEVETDTRLKDEEYEGD